MNLLITESPRDAMQSLTAYIPTQSKADYINQLLKVGFDIIDVGSFVSEKAIPQMKDTAEVLKKLNLSNTRSAIMVLIANLKGIEKAIAFDEVSWLAFPFSVSPTFLKLNINTEQQQALQLVDIAKNKCETHNKKLKVYLTMAFGNPYQDVFNPEIVMKSVVKLQEMGINYITLSDITGVSDRKLINKIYSQLLLEFPKVEFGFHLHTKKESYFEKIDAAYISGCRSFDTVINAMGGCPMTGYELVNNLNTLDLLNYFQNNNVETSVNFEALNEAIIKNKELFTKNK